MVAQHPDSLTSNQQQLTTIITSTTTTIETKSTSPIKTQKHNGGGRQQQRKTTQGIKNVTIQEKTEAMPCDAAQEGDRIAQKKINGGEVPAPTSPKKKVRSHYEAHLSALEVAQGLQQGTLFQGQLRINSFDRNEAYVTAQGVETDVYIYGESTRNRALDSDIVIIKLNPAKQWRKREGKDIQPTGKVVAISQKLRKQNIVGILKPAREEMFVTSNDQFAYFIPVDKRYPRVMIPISECPQHFMENPADLQKDLFVASILKWTASSPLPVGQLKQCVGKFGEFETEIKCLLIQNDIRCKDFTSEVQNDAIEYGTALDSQLLNSELKMRADLRRHRVFSIDPSGCKDVDDTMSIARISDDIYEIGVHIADVSFFVKPNSALDHEARQRATSVYLLNHVIPMLPKNLSENLCSLNQGVDRLAFSVFIQVNSQGAIVTNSNIPSVRFSKSIIQNCSKMCYETAEDIIQGKIVDASGIPDNEKPVNDQSGMDLINDILLLSQITTNMRRARYNRGLLDIIHDEYQYHFDENGQPSHTTTKQSMTSCSLVEELMLLANSVVAQHFLSTKDSVLRECAVLRNHKRPLPQRLSEFEKYCQENAKIQVDVSNVLTLNNAIHKVHSENQGMGALLFYQVRRVMQHADYIRLPANPSDMFHYGLNMSCYTHFTSPIRRYSDLLAHRLLSSIVCSTSFPHTPEQVEQILSTCNSKRLDVKKVEELSQKAFLCDIYGNPTKQHTARGIICGMNQKNLIVYFPSINSEIRVPFEDVQSLIKKRTHNRKEKKITIAWNTDNTPDTTFSIFDLVECVLGTKETSEAQVEISARLHYDIPPRQEPLIS